MKALFVRALTCAVISVAGAVSALTGAPSPWSGGAVEAVDSALTIVKVPASSLSLIVGPNGQTFGDFERDLTAVVDSRICASISLSGPSNTDSDGNKVLVIGTADQPLVCRQPSGSISFFVQGGWPLQDNLPISPGSTLMRRLTIEPPIDPGPVPPHRRRFFHISVDVDGSRVVGGGVRGFPPALLIVPTRVQQPLAVSQSIPYTFPIEANGRVDLALPDEDYLITYQDVRFTVVGATDTIAVQATDLINFPAVRLQDVLTSDGTVKLDAVSRPIATPGPPITSPIGGGVLPPVTGNGGLR